MHQCNVNLIRTPLSIKLRQGQHAFKISSSDLHEDPQLQLSGEAVPRFQCPLRVRAGLARLPLLRELSS